MFKKVLKAGAVLGLSAVVLTGCATKSYVDEQDAKILEKLNALEGKISQMEQMHKTEHPKIVGRIEDLETRVGNMEAEHEDLKNQIKAVDQKAEKNAAAIRGLEDRISALEAKLNRLSENIERVMKKSLAK
ncbi:hypothetical protein [Persephonella sp.]|uniref:hypothetical protein n=1 Tax=Persephonella sp. TaxID=2060922 RepID=UPI0025E601A5|nr:hypothetical protein [Persephonella sp.]